jgi:orotidine-5'-phosphate decarboxylase
MKQLDLTNPKNRIIIALDVSSTKEIRYWVSLLKNYVGYFKIGFQLIHSVGGPQAIRAVQKSGGKVFYDCKLHDIPETMKKSAHDISELGVDIFNVHVSASVRGMQYAMEACGESIVAGVTVLTSFSEEDCLHVYNKNVREKVTSFTLDLVEARVPAVICSAAEAGMIKNVLGMKDLLLITPGIRPIWAAPNDQNPDRIMSPFKAITEGSDLLVIGRPILSPPDKIGGPVEAALRIKKEIEDALSVRISA